MIRSHSTLPDRQPPPDLTIEAGLSFHDIFHADGVMEVASDVDKPTVIRRLVNQLARTKRFEMQFADEITIRITSRESDCSTAIGKGFAFPHLRTRYVNQFVGAIAIATAGLQFNAFDAMPTKLVLLTLSPHDQRQQHADLLSRLVSLMSDKSIAIQLSTSPSALEVYRCLCNLGRHFPVKDRTE